MTERTGIVTVEGNPLTLLGTEVKVGDAAPDCTVLDHDLNPVELSSFSGKVCLFASVPSLDTGVCDTEVRRFNEEAVNLGEDVAVVVVSVDLPFAQSRWCGAAGVDRVTTLSDHRNTAFGECYGVLIKELRLLARAVFVIDRDRIVRYVQIVDDLTHEPDYDSALDAVKELVG